MKKQWEEAMSGGNTPETPHRSRRGSASLEGGVGANLFSPGAGGCSAAPCNAYFPTDEGKHPLACCGVLAQENIRNEVQKWLVNLVLVLGFRGRVRGRVRVAEPPCTLSYVMYTTSFTKAVQKIELKAVGSIQDG